MKSSSVSCFAYSELKFKIVQLLWLSHGGFEYLQEEFYNLGYGYAK